MNKKAKLPSPKEYSSEELALIGIGYDMCIDKICEHLAKQIESLEAAKRKDSALMIALARDVVRHFIEHFKKSKGDPDYQVFTKEEVRRVVDHVTGTTQSLNNATMSYFDEIVMPMLVEGKLILKQFTKPKENGEDKGTDNRGDG